MIEFLTSIFGEQTVAFYQTFIEDKYYMLLVQGIQYTIQLTGIALSIGVVIGLIVALIQMGEMPKKHSFITKTWYYILKLLKWITSAYIYIIRGTPVVLQIVLMWNVVFATSDINRIWVGGLAFGINSGAYMAELIRAGIQGLDKGQMEAGRSLGFNYIETMRYIVFPQALTQMLPAIISEFIVLIKETAIIGYIGGLDLMKAQDIMMSRTYNASQPLLIVGLCYFIISGALTMFMKKIEKKITVGK